MHPFKKLALSVAAVGLVAGSIACGDDDTSPCTTATVTVAPATATIEAGATVQLTATALDAAGNACGTATWASDNEAVATVSTSGLVTGVTAGTANITATAGGVSGSSAVTVTVDAAPQITMTAPSGGAAVLPGGMVTIEWTATDDVGVTGVDLSYTADGIAEPVSIATDVQGSSYEWTTPDMMLFGVLVQGVAKDAAGQTAEDETTDVFAIVQFSEAGYVTSAACQDCHPSSYADVFNSSGHPYKLSKIEGGVAPDIPNSPGVTLPAGTTWDDFAYMIGGYGWKARWIQLDGYIYTPAAGQNQWNLLPMSFSDYNPGEVRPYNCGRCHTTGWVDSDDGDPTNNQDGLEGFLGTYEETGISCEQCHGPGVDHVSSGAAHTVDPTPSEFCGTCHNRGGIDANIPASGGFIRHHEQYNEWANSAHGDGMGMDVGCNDCHNPHLGTRYDMGGFVASCAACHPNQAATNAHAVPIEGDNGADPACITCHMSQATKSAVADASNPNFVGDVKTHIFTINPGELNKDYFFGADPTTVETAAEGVTLDFVCYQCHTDPVTGTGGGFSEKTLAELSAKAMGIHTP